jgi:hypothetical protein
VFFGYIPEKLWWYLLIQAGRTQDFLQVLRLQTGPLFAFYTALDHDAALPFL